MKRYIKAAVQKTMTLKDWIDEHEDSLSPKIPLEIYTISPFVGKSPTDPTLLFDGTFNGLCQAWRERKNEFIPEYESYDLDDYLNKFNRYPIDEIIQLNNGGYRIIIVT